MYTHTHAQPACYTYIDLSVPGYRFGSRETCFELAVARKKTLYNLQVRFSVGRANVLGAFAEKFVMFVKRSTYLAHFALLCVLHMWIHCPKPQISCNPCVRMSIFLCILMHNITGVARPCGRGQACRAAFPPAVCVLPPVPTCLECLAESKEGCTALPPDVCALSPSICLSSTLSMCLGVTGSCSGVASLHPYPYRLVQQCDMVFIHCF